MTNLRDAIAEVLASANITFREADKYFITRCINPSHPDVEGKDLKFYKDSGVAYCFSCKSTYSLSYFAKQVGVEAPKDDNYVRIKTIVNDSPFKGIPLPKGFLPWSGGIDKYHITEEMTSKFKIGYCRFGFSEDADLVKCSGCAYTQWIDPVSGNCELALSRSMVPITKGDMLYSLECRDLSRLSYKKVVYPPNSKTSLTIFNYDNLDKTKPLYVVEGIKSCLKVYNYLNKNVTAIFSNRLKGIQGDLLKEFSHVILIPDKGRAGEDTVKDFRELGLKKLIVVDLPWKASCGSCGSIYEGEIDLCNQCHSDDISYWDAFDFSVEDLKAFMESRSVSYIQRQPKVTNHSFIKVRGQ